MKRLLPALVILFIFCDPSTSFATALTSQQASSLIAVVQSSPGTPANAFVPLITAFSNITVNQAASLITVVQAAPGVPANAFINLLTSFTVDTLTMPQATTATTTTPSPVIQQAIQTTQQTTQPPSPTPVSPAVQATTTPITPPVSADPSVPLTTLLQEDFDSYESGSLLGQGGWQNYSNGQNFIVQGTSTEDGVGAVYVYANGDNVITRNASSVANGQESFYIKTDNRANWSAYADGNAQIRLSEGQGFSSNIFTTVNFKKDGTVAYFDPVHGYQNFATYADSQWTLLEIQWLASQKMARYRVNNGTWTNWLTFQGASSFTGFNSVGFDFYQGGTGGVFIDNLY